MDEKYHSHKPEPDYMDLTNVVSSTECTGLIQGFPQDDNEIDAYTEICDIPKPEKPKPKKKDVT